MAIVGSQNGQKILRIKALAERSSYIENVLRHALVAELSRVAWQRDPALVLQVFNAEVDAAGFDIVLGLGEQLRYVQLNQAHAEKTPSHCSVRLAFSRMPGSCVVLMIHHLEDLALRHFFFFGSTPEFFGSTPEAAMPTIGTLPASKSPGRRNAAGQRKVREHYRDVKVKMFEGPLSAGELFDKLFPNSVCA